MNKGTAVLSSETFRAFKAEMMPLHKPDAAGLLSQNNPAAAQSGEKLATVASSRYSEEGGPNMPTRNVNLTDHYDSFIEASIAEGRFANASEAVRAGLNLLERQAAEDKTRLSWLRAATEEAFAALDRGEGVQLNSADDIDVFVDGVLRGRRAARADAHG